MDVIKIDEEISLSQVTENDRPALVKYLNNEDIYNNTLRLPRPYTKRDADWWIIHVEEIKRKHYHLMDWAIRDKNSGLIGGIGFCNVYPNDDFKDQIGYWLAPRFWNKGIMTKVVRKICEIGFSELNLLRIEALVFTYNKASAKVLEKAGFAKEGILRKNYLKDDKFIDSIMFAILKEEFDKLNAGR